MTRWTNDRENLWKEVVKRSSRPAPAQDAKKDDSKATAQRIEKAALAALSVGDVRKALQQLKNTPIAPKGDATYKKLQDLHPGGNNPAPIPRVGNKELYQAPHFKVDVVRSALSSLGPGSAAGLLGYKPYLLQQGMRSESAFEGAVTSAVNHLAAGKAPKFLKRILAGGVSIALQKNENANPFPGVR